MVLIRLNLYQYREQVRRSIMIRKASLDSKWDPLIASWLAYALMQDGLDQNPHLLELVQDLERWARENVQDVGRYLGPLCLLGYLQLRQGQIKSEIEMRVLEQITTIDPETKFSPFRAPEQMFLVALLMSSLNKASEETKNFLLNIIRNQLHGPVQRRIMF